MTLFLSFLSLLNLSAQAAPQTFKNMAELCAANHFSSVSVSGLQKYKAIEDQNLCELKASQVGKTLPKLIAQMGAMNRKAAAFFGARGAATPLEEILGPPMEIRVVGSDFGPLDSARGSIAVFPDWDGEGVSAPTYLHELGHVVIRREGVHESVKDLAESILLNEALADFSAFENTGTIFGTDRKLPQECFARVREIPDPRAVWSQTQRYSYKAAAGFFKTAQMLGYLRGCCELLEGHEPKLPEFGAVLKKEDKFRAHTPASQRFCKTVDERITESGEVLAFDKKPFDPTKVPPSNAATSLYDNHQLGVPIHAFLVKLAYATGAGESAPVQATRDRARKLLLEAMGRLRNDALKPKQKARYRAHYGCYLAKDKSNPTNSTVEVDAWAWSHLVNALEDLVTEEKGANKNVFAKLVEEFGLSKALQVSRRGRFETSQMKAFLRMSALLNDPSDPFIGRNTACYDALSGSEPPTRGTPCEIVCKVRN